MKMKNIQLILGLVILINLFCSCTHTSKSKKNNINKVNPLIDNKLAYFGQGPPSTTPEVFAPDFISKQDRNEFGCTFSKDGRTFFFGVDNGEQADIYITSLEGEAWTSPEKLFKNASFSSNDPMFSPDEERLYFISNKPLDSTRNKKDIDIWYSKRNDGSWSSPINAGNVINSEMNEYYTSFTQDGTMYFSSNKNSEKGKEYNFDIYRSEIENGVYLEPYRLPEEINTNRYEADVFIAPDESYIIFCAIRREGLGIGDLYISFKDDNENWSPSINMGDSINSEHHELCPYVTKDGKYLFYTSNQDIYWVSSKIIENYREKIK